MSIVIVGGHDRMHCRYKEICTGTVAHKMVRVASGQAEKSGAIIKHCNSSSACALNDALTECFCKAV